MMPEAHAVRSPRAEAAGWIVAAMLVLAMHAGATALALMRWPDAESAEDVSGAVLIELAPMPVSAARDAVDLAIGPETPQQVAADPAAKEAKPEPEKELPRVDASPLAPDPEVVLPEQHTEEVVKPDDDTPQETVRDTRSDAQAAADTRAPPKVDAKEGAVTAAPAAGLSAAPAKIVASWKKLLVSRLNRYKRYPGVAQARREQGTADVAFTIDRSGRVVARRLRRSSGFPVLDAEALEVLQRASPLPAPPSLAAGETFELSLPIQFRIK